jgi:hypothetical protein
MAGLDIFDDSEELQQEIPVEEAPKADKAEAYPGAVNLNRQLQLLQKQLLQRTQPNLFDPVLMKMAAGFLAPTKTGSFGESLGYAAQAGSEEAEKERARRIDNEKLQFEILKYQDAAKRKQQAMGLLSGLAGPKGESTTASPTELMPPNQVATAAVKNPSILETIKITPDILAAIAATGDKEVYNMALAMQKSQIQMGQLQLQERDIQQKGFDTVERPHPFDPGATIKLSRENARIFDSIDPNDENAMYAFMAKTKQPGYFGKYKAPTAPTAGAPTTPTEGAPTEETEGFKRPPTTSEREEEKLRRTKRIEADIDADKAEKANLFARQENARSSLLPTATALYNYSTNPETKKAFDYMTKKGLLPAITSLVENGLSVGNFRIGLPDVQDAMRKAGVQGATDKDIETVRMASQYITKLQLDMAKADAKGSISNYEDQLFERANISKNDSARVVALKSELLMTKAKMDDFVATKYADWVKKNPNGYVYEFKQSPEMQKLTNQYNKKLDEIQSKYGFGFSQSDVK